MGFENYGNGEVPTPVEHRPPSSLNLVDVNSRNNNRNDNFNANRNDNLNQNRNDNVNQNRNDNVNTNLNQNRNDNTNQNRNDNSNRNDVKSNSNSSSQVNDNRSENVRYYGGSATAPNVYSGGYCSEGGSAGVYVLGIGVSGGKSTINQECLKKEDFQRTMQQVCKSSDEHAMVALQSFQLELQAGNQMSTNPFAPGVGAGARRIANAKAEVSLQLDSVCSTLANSADATMDSMKKMGLDKPIIIPAEASNAAEQKIIDEAVATKLEDLNKRVTKVEQKPTEINLTTITVAPEPVHKPAPVHRPHPKPAAKAEDCDVKKK